MQTLKTIGLDPHRAPAPEPKLIQYINLKLAALGCPTVKIGGDHEFDLMAANFLLHQRETNRLLADYLCPADQRIQDFLDDYLKDADVTPKLPSHTFVLDHYGISRMLSLPAGQDSFVSDIVSSYRVKQGVLHNPKSDRRTTHGIFHVTEGGLPVPADKIAAPKMVFARMLHRALNPPGELLRLPFTSGQTEQAEIFVSLLLRPVVCPEVQGFTPQKTMEVRFFVPGDLVSNLDFVESIFGNAGDPYLPENDAGLDVHHWTGHTGCVVLAPHLVGMTKKQAGLPPWEQATERQRQDGMAWKTEDELYNQGAPFKLTCRDERGVMVTIIGDNYFGYCKKEIKTQISFSANLFGACEEEHAGGALVFPSYDLGEEFSGNLHMPRLSHNFSEMLSLFGEAMQLQPEGYAIDKQYPDILYVPEDVRFDLAKQWVSWPFQGGEQGIKMLPGITYVRPSGYKVHMEKPPGHRNWRLAGTRADPTFCHKPCTVSGGGKSEISKPITDAIIQGPVFVADFKKDFEVVAELINRDYGGRFKSKKKTDHRPVLSSSRSLGSVIKLLTPAVRDYSPQYNEWLSSIPQYIKELVFVVKRFYKPEWGENWREHFSVDIINGTPGNELKCDNRKLVANYVRIAFEQDGSWRTFGLRQDYRPAAKLAQEDDISASVVVPSEALPGLRQVHSAPALKFVKNCEYRLFQRPDDAIHRGYDKQTESDFALPGNFFSNYEPLPPKQAKEMVEDVIEFDKFTPPMQELIKTVAKENAPAYFVSSAHPRLINGKPSKNPRYLQTRPDLVNPRDAYLAQISMRLQRKIPFGEPVLTPVAAIVPGRRNNPPDPVAGIRPLAVYNPIHYMELPELFMEFICSMTGKSPSTTGAGSEGALTKGPFNALPPIIDLNNALVAYLLTDASAFITAAGFVGPHYRVDHDISLLVPEIWCRMYPEERDPKFLLKNGYLEKCENFNHQGAKVLASRLGYRITASFVRTFFGRMFNHPHLVFPEPMLRPEKQDPSIFADGMDNIVMTQKRVASLYFEDGSIEMAAPPLKALLHIMAHDHYQGKSLDDPAVRNLFTREHLLESDWYKQRLVAKQKIDLRLWTRHANYLEKFMARKYYSDEAGRLGIQQRLQEARQMLAQVKSRDYLKSLDGTLGAQPLAGM